METSVAQVNGYKRMCGKPVMPTGVGRPFGMASLTQTVPLWGQVQLGGNLGEAQHTCQQTLPPWMSSLLHVSPTEKNLSATGLVIDGFKKEYSVLFGKIKSLSNLITIHAFFGA